MRKILPLCAVLLLAACSNQPNQLILNPVYQSGKITQINSNVSTSVIDLRGDNVTLKIIDKLKEFLKNMALLNLYTILQLNMVDGMGKHITKIYGRLIM